MIVQLIELLARALRLKAHFIHACDAGVTDRGADVYLTRYDIVRTRFGQAVPPHLRAERLVRATFTINRGRSSPC